MIKRSVTHFGKIGVVMGGCSSEREISLKSGRAIYDSLWSQGCDVLAIDIRESDDEKIKEVLKERKIDLAFIALHGALGEDGRIQSICEELQIPYTGSDSKSSQLAFNKVSTQRLLRGQRVVVPNFVVVNKNENADLIDISSSFEGYPLVVKPSSEGSSIGIRIVQNAEELFLAIEEARAFGAEVMVEEFIEGREVTVGILNNKPLEIVEVQTNRVFFDFTAKYESGHTDYRVPAVLPVEIKHILQETALKVHTILGCSDLSRVDFILDEALKPYVLEINTIPGFTQTSLLPKAAGCVGINFDQLCLTLTEMAYGKTKKENFLTADY